MDFDTNHPKLIIAAVACDRNGLTNEAAAFSVRLSAFFYSAHPDGAQNGGVSAYTVQAVPSIFKSRSRYVSPAARAAIMVRQS